MTQKFTSDKPSMEEILRHKNQNTASVEININAELANRIKSLEREHMIAMRKDEKVNESPKAPAIRKAIDKLEDEAIETTIRFTFKDLGRKKFEDTWKSCPPTPEQKEDGFEWDPDAFTPKLMAMSCVEAGDDDHMTLEQAESIYNDWSTAEVSMLATTALNANMGVGTIPLSGSGIDPALSTELNSIISQNEESPTPSG